MPRHLPKDVYERLFRGDRLAAARLITTLEQTPRRSAEIVRRIHQKTGRAHIIGITGAPGAGKSTLVDGLADVLRKRGQTVGIIAVDPSSPFTGGALLGDRVRMQKRSTDKDVFIRSMASRGSLGGLSSTTSDAIKVLDALGKDVVIIETVGVGQAEIDIVRVADTTIVVLVPGMGDEIQSIKAGIMEIADIFVVNKADRDGADKTVAEIEMMLMMGLGSEDLRKDTSAENTAQAAHHAPEAVPTADDPANPGTSNDEPSFFEQLLASGVWYPPIVKAIAAKAEGIDEILDLAARHLQHMDATGGRDTKRLARAERELRANMRDAMLLELEDRESLRARFGNLVAQIAAREEDPHTAAAELIAHFKSGDQP